ncbi:hypothetical protein VTN77DRAFT_522 [Rasamsonia byssochlamydoides]|uniref:uncharacterized protein n=1 Tax=Rasamsonia byssochlamydoides TaxID=89139 RepID=UPI00374492CF
MRANGTLEQPLTTGLLKKRPRILSARKDPDPRMAMQSWESARDGRCAGLGAMVRADVQQIFEASVAAEMRMMAGTGISPEEISPLPTI